MANDATSQSWGRANIATGSFTGGGSEVDVELGFMPRFIKLINTTDVIIYEFIEGMADTATLKSVSAGANSVDTGSMLVPDANGFTVAAGAAVNGKDIVWMAAD